MSKIPYAKSALSYTDQLQQLKDRGLLIEDDSKALHILENISYYRLSGYWHPLLSSPKSEHTFNPNSSFTNVFKLYCFDRELRKLILGELEKIEIAVRAKMIYLFWHSHGSFWYNDKNLFKDTDKFSTSIYKLKEEKKRSDEEFIKSFYRKYSDQMPPSCMILEISSFGQLSNLYSNIKPNRSKRAVANYFGLDDNTFASWLHSFCYIRNICAHHSRLWNKEMRISPTIPTSPINKFLISKSTNGLPINNKVYFILSMIVYLLDIINPKSTFKFRLKELLKAYPNVDVTAMGFPTNWEQESLWL